jgi:hypothetical protein
VAINVKKIIVKVAKCKQSIILTFIQNTNHYNYTYCQKATDEKDGSGNCP